MTKLRSVIASALSLSLALLAPGSRAYAELAKQAPGAARGGAPILAPQVKTLSTVNLGQFSVPKLLNTNVLPNGVQHGSLPLAVGQTIGAQDIQSGVMPTVSAVSAVSALDGKVIPNAVQHGSLPLAAQASEAKQTLTQRLNAPLPDLANVSDSSAKDQSSADFAVRIGQDEIATSASAPMVSGKSSQGPPSLSAASAKTSKSKSWIPSVVSKLVASKATQPVFMFAAAAGATAMFGGGVNILQNIIAFPIIILSLILHEIGHARVASWLGDKTAVLQGRGSFNPKTWGTHIDPMWTIVVPFLTMMLSGFIFGGARPVPVEPRNFTNQRESDRGMALVALAGPGVNLILAAIGAIAFAGLGAIGAAPLLVAIAGMFTFLNSMLAIFNMMPVFPLDGHHILRWLLPQSIASRLDSFYRQGGMMAWLPGIVLIIIGSKFGIFAALTMAVTGFLVSGSAMLWSLVLGAGVMAGSLKTAPPAPGQAAPVESRQESPAELVVILEGSQKVIPEDAHLSFVDVSATGGVANFAQTQQKMLMALSDAGLSPDLLAGYNATPVATYKRINAATLRLDASKAQAFIAELQSRGHKVFPNSERRIIVPVPVNPEDMDPQNRGAITMDENLAITKADKVHAIASKRWGNPGVEGKLRRIIRSVFGGETAPQTPVAVVDTGADITHPLLNKGVTAKNVTSGDDKDDNGHGTWVTSMVRNYAKWNNNVTSYKTFVNGGATLDDILKALTAAANDGNIVISNSWGSDDGDPNGPDSQLVRKLAEEGHIMVFAASNAGPRANTIGSPAIVAYRTADGTPRVTAVAAAGRDKKIAYFSSRGPASPMTKNDPNYPKRPDLTALGYNTDGAWPVDGGGADKVDPVKGPLKAISGTSMSTPSVAGAIVLLAQLFNVTTVGARLDAVVKAVMDTLEKTGQPRDAEGEGFINVEAAYNALKAALEPTKEQRAIWRFFRGR